MRKQLGKKEGKREAFSGTFVRLGTKKGWQGSVEGTVLLREIKDENKVVVADHLWFNLTKEFDCLDLKEGEIVSFNARVKEYTKGYFGWDEEKAMESPIATDYKLSYPTKIKKIGRKEKIITK